MDEKITPERICALIDGATAQIRANHPLLSQLDSAVGDGDHGTTILRAMESASRSAAANMAGDLKTMFAAVGWEVMGCDGGSTGPLLGSFFAGMADALPAGREADVGNLLASFEAGVAKMHKQSRAQIGDKTMMDAFLPAVAALKSAGADLGLKPALTRAAAAAAEGAEATRGMRAKFGRARNLGDRVIGHPDPGAVSASLLFKGFAEAS